MTPRRWILAPWWLAGACANATVVVTVPAPGSVDVSVLVEPEIVVPARHIELRAVGVAEPVPIRITEPIPQTRQVQPLEPLDYGTTYTLWVDGEPYAFRTATNPRRATFSYQTNGDVTSTRVRRFEIDPLGFEIREQSVSDAGPDGTWLTPDDGLGSYTDIRRVGPLVVERVVTNQPGPDGEWLTADDGVASRTDYTYTDSQFPWAVRSFGPGPDEAWGTADDEQTGLLTHEHDEHGRPIRQTTVSPGPDARFETGDDVPWSYATWFRDEDGRPFAFGAAYAPGLDGTWFTDDDFTSGAWLEHDVLGRQVRVVGIEPGADNVLFTDDDLETGSTERLFGNDGRWTHSIVRDGTGAMVERHELERDVRGLVIRVVSYVDDLEAPAGYATTRFDDAGLRTLERGFVGPGADGVWFNADDELRSETLYHALVD